MESIMGFLYNIRPMDILDILIVAFVFYKLLIYIKDTRAEQLVKGIIIIIIMTKLSEIANLHVVHFILDKSMTLGLIAILIVFQPELRRALEHIGRSKFVSKSLSADEIKERKMYVEELLIAISNLSKYKVGGLIVIEDEIGMNEILEDSVIINGEISSQLIENIFFPNSPLHDGAIIIRNFKVIAAGCVLPLSKNKRLSKSLGTRHRAALGVAEVSDALVIVVSEETGAISIAKEGKLNRFLDVDKLRKIIYQKYLLENKKNSFFSRK